MRIFPINKKCFCEGNGCIPTQSNMLKHMGERSVACTCGRILFNEQCDNFLANKNAKLERQRKNYHNKIRRFLSL